MNIIIGNYLDYSLCTLCVCVRVYPQGLLWIPKGVRVYQVQNRCISEWQHITYYM